MANLLLTEKCVRSCPYCFAQQHMESADNLWMDWEDLIYIADLHETSGEHAIALLGGEPTLHPELTEFTLYLVERGFHVNIFTSGIVSDKSFEKMESNLASIHPDRISFVCNLNHPDLSTAAEKEKIDRFLNSFGHLTVPGFNVYKLDFDMDYLIQYVNRFGMRKHIRLGLCHPIVGEKNTYIALDDLKKMAEHLMSYVPVLEKFRLKLGFDCGMPMCLFSEEQLGILFKLNGGNVIFNCGPALDIGPDMSVWSCFPLSNYQRKSIYDFDSLNDIRRFYEQLHHKVRTEAGGIFEECDSCKYREENLCSGGCLAHLLTRFQDEPRIRLKEVYP
ncbi:radical SAM protein [Bacteroidota bacterium]